MLEMNATSLSRNAGSRSWMRDIWESLRLGVRRFDGPTGGYYALEATGGDRMKPVPILELAWIDGKPVIMGRNQTMKMLIQAALPAPRKRLFGFRSKLPLPAEPLNAHRPSR